MTEYRAVDEAALRLLLTDLRNTSWSWSEADVPGLGEDRGWALTRLAPTYSALFDPGWGLGGRTMRFSFDDDVVTDVTIRLSSQVDEDDAAGQVFLADVFADSLATGDRAIGPPSSHRIGAQPRVVWRGDRTTLVLTMLPVVVTLFWRTTTRHDHLERVAADFEKARAAGLVGRTP